MLSLVKLSHAGNSSLAGVHHAARHRAYACTVLHIKVANVYLGVKTAAFTVPFQWSLCLQHAAAATVHPVPGLPGCRATSSALSVQKLLLLIPLPLLLPLLLQLL